MNKPQCICSWCGQLVRDGNPFKHASHTVCHACRRKYFGFHMSKIEWSIIGALLVCMAGALLRAFVWP